MTGWTGEHHDLYLLDDNPRRVQHFTDKGVIWLSRDGIRHWFFGLSETIAGLLGRLKNH